ncbi:hypothetical protein QL285_064109 [Trifolium repens]|nr:hypothetical protein QL285_064109 [Trifolium repens]
MSPYAQLSSRSKEPMHALLNQTFSISSSTGPWVSHSAQLRSSKSPSLYKLNLVHPSACPTQLDHELLLQLVHLSSIVSSTFSMLNSARAGALPSACPAQLDHEHTLQPGQLSLTMSSTFSILNSSRSYSFNMLSSVRP